MKWPEINLFDYSKRLHKDGNLILNTYSLQRSGQHLIIDWISRGLTENTAHFNHCRFYPEDLGFSLLPMKGRISIYNNGDKKIDSGKQGRKKVAGFIQDVDYNKEIYSIEDRDHSHFLYARLNKKADKNIFILRDPCNWLASSFKHGKSGIKKLERKKEILKKYLDKYSEDENSKKDIFIDYNKFVVDVEYRKELSVNLGMARLTSAEKALDNIPQFGGGSSFSETKKSVHKEKVFKRWENYQNNSDYLKILNDKELISKSEGFFSTNYFNKLL